MRKILLVEPNYSNKYPPIGLMKIARYHRILGDEVRFFKGDMRDFVIEEIYDECLEKLVNIDPQTQWNLKKSEIKSYIKNKQPFLIDKLKIEDNPEQFLLAHTLESYADKYRKKFYEKDPKWDRIYVTTLFTFYWKITVQTIEFCKKLVKSPKELHVGGVLATLLEKQLEEATGVKPYTGLLDKPGILDPDNDIIVDDLPLDYSILDEIEYKYPTQSAYFTFMTKGCTRSCKFCSVPFLEPTYKDRVEGTSDKFGFIKENFGEQQNLLLMDNNVLASPRFPEIIDEIKEMGFVKGATFVEPNQLDLAVKKLEESYNDRAYIKKIHRLLNHLLDRLRGQQKQTYYNLLSDHGLLNFDTVTKDALLSVYPQIKDTYEKYRSKKPRQRFVDFNQGTDCRYVTEDLMKKMSEIPIRPLRIAFDYMSLKNTYVKAVKLAAKYEIKELSNYILYNFNDKPEDLYGRLKLNADLCKELEVAIFSFPMKYIPLFGEEAKHRHHTGKHWNKKFIRAVQSILNVTKGIVAPSTRNEKTSFFEEAFGKDLNEFFEIMYMPETYIIYRHLCRKLEYTQLWEEEYRSLSEEDLQTAQKIIQKSDFSENAVSHYNPSKRVEHFLRHYTILSRDIINDNDKEYEKIKAAYDELINCDPFIELTLTYDYDIPNGRQISVL